MAKGKKRNLSGNATLEHLLVPVNEQPYKVPANWCWVKFHYLKGSETSFFDGDWILSENMDPAGDVRLIQLSDIGIGEFLDKSSKFISNNTFYNLNCSELREGDVLISRMAEPIARSCILPLLSTKCITAVDIAVMRCNNSIVSNKYVNYLCNTSWFTDLANNLARGTTRVRITRKNLGDMPFPLPPLNEQQRIVARIEGLFAKLDLAKELVKNSLDSFEIRKSAILHKAFSGELTAKWREEHGIGLDSWLEKTFDQVAYIKSNLVDPSEYMDSPHIAPDNIERRTGRLLKYRTIKEDGVLSGKHKFYNGQILYSKIRPYLSKVVVVDFDGLCSADMYPIQAKENTKYLWYYMLSDAFLEQASSAGSRSVLPKINQKELAILKVPIPTVPEQQEVVLILDKLFSKEQETKELIDVINQIDGMKKAILVRAFRGELGTNDPTEESSVKLLIETLENKINESETANKHYPKKEFSDVGKVSKLDNIDLLNVLKQYGGKLTPLELYKKTELDIEEFYAALKESVSIGDIVEDRKIDGEVYLVGKR